MSDGTAYEAELAPHVVPLASRDRLFRAIGNARFVLLGEATHGSAELYRERAWITEQLITEHGFDAIVIEADWPDAHRVHRFLTGRSEIDTNAEEALRSFTRFPLWMWRNAEVTAFLERMNVTDLRPALFGLDLYSLHASIDAILDYLKRTDHDAFLRARSRYACFDHFGGDTTAYGMAAGTQLDVSCERDVTQQLIEMQVRRLELSRQAMGDADPDAMFQVEQNAQLVKDAEAYYRSMIHGSVVTWNLRDQHMANTLAAVVQHLDRRLGRPCKLVVWAHNSHLGDARATQMGEEGELNVGQLARERYGRDAFLVGFTTYDGTVTAAHEWDEPAKKMRVRPALAGSHEDVLHQFAVRARMPNFIMLPDQNSGLPATFRRTRLERAIGVIYRPKTERHSHYFRARLADQFDAIVHIDRTTAVAPLDPWSEVVHEDLPETFPFAL
jgi:erythromycin esterase-like protein